MHRRTGNRVILQGSISSFKESGSNYLKCDLAMQGGQGPSWTVAPVNEIK
jgi:hypothetical protein